MNVGECDLCANPYPYMCAECDDTTDEGPDVAPAVAAPVMATVRAKAIAAMTNRVWIGSGDSGIVSECLDMPHMGVYS